MFDASTEVLPSQWLDRNAPSLSDVPERRLLLAVLGDAVHCLQIGGKPRAQALVWIREQNAAVPIPFRFLCEGLGMEAAPLARRLLASGNASVPLLHRRRLRVR